MSVYLDWNATTPLSSAAQAAWLQAQQEFWGNPSSVHEHGQKSRHSLDQAKASMARAIGARPYELVLTSGGTESNNLAIAHALRDGGAALASCIEHSSILRPLQKHAASLELIPVDDRGCIRVETLTDMLKHTNNYALIAIQFANNELGIIQPVQELVACIREHAPGVPVLIDACQGVGKVPVDCAALDADFLSFSAHKFSGPKGVGCLRVGPGHRLQAQLEGGRQQQDRRSGTEDTPSACAMAAALEDALAHADDVAQRQTELLQYCIDQIAAEREITIFAAGAAMYPGKTAHAYLPNTLSIACAGQVADDLVLRLDLRGISVSKGSACMAERDEPSHVIAALGVPDELARSTIRVSLGATTSREDIDVFIQAYLQETAS